MQTSPLSVNCTRPGKLPVWNDRFLCGRLLVARVERLQGTPSLFTLCLLFWMSHLLHFQTHLFTGPAFHVLALLIIGVLPVRHMFFLIVTSYKCMHLATIQHLRYQLVQHRHSISYGVLVDSVSIICHRVLIILKTLQVKYNYTVI